MPLARLQGERGRTSGQMRLFAKVLRRGDFLGARIDTALPSVSLYLVQIYARLKSVLALLQSLGQVTFL